MIPEPPNLTRGPRWLQAYLNTLRDFCVAVRPLPSDTIDISESAEGTRLDALPQGDTSAPAIFTQPFQLISTSGGETPTPMIRVIPSTLAGGSSTDLGFAEADDPPYLLSPVEGVLQGGITIDGTTGEVTSRWLEIVSALDDDTDTTFYVEIGTVSQDPESGAWSVTNSRYGPIAAQICRNWYAAEAPFFWVSWS